MDSNQHRFTSTKTARLDFDTWFSQTNTSELCVVVFALKGKQKRLQNPVFELQTKGLNQEIFMRGILKLFFGIMIGGIYGMLFAQKPGKKLRAEMAKSDNPLKTLFDEGVKVDLEARDTLVEWAKNSEDLQKVMETGKDQFNAVVDGAKEMSDEARAQAQKKMKEVAANATKAANDLKKTATKKSTTAKKTATKKVKAAKKTVTKKATTAKKTVTKKANAARKTASNTVKKIKKS